MPLMAFWLFYCFLVPVKKEVVHCSSLRILEVRQQCFSFTNFISPFLMSLCTWLFFVVLQFVCVSPWFSLIAFCSDCRILASVCVRFVQPFLSIFCLFQWLLNQLPSLESIEVMWRGVA